MKITERIELVNAALSHNKRIALYLVDDKKTAQFRYRCQNTLDATINSKTWQSVWFLKTEMKHVEKLLPNIHLLIILRQSAKDNQILQLLSEAKSHHIKTLCDLDDLIFDYRNLPLLMKSTNSKNIIYWFGYFWGIRRIAKKVDGFICTNDFLGNKLRQSFNKPYAVIPNSLNRQQVELAKKYSNQYDAKSLSIHDKHIRDRFLIGYFSGSPTHTKDFQIIEPALAKFMRVYPNAHLLIVGYMKLSPVLQTLADEGRITTKPLVDYLKLQQLIASADINLAPLQLNDFTNCKSELKFFEAGIMHTITLASPNYSFSKAIKDGQNGFLADTDEWYDKLEYIYHHSSRKIADLAYHDSLAHYYGKEFLAQVEQSYANLHQ